MEPVLAAPIRANGLPAKDPVLLWQQSGAWVAESTTWQKLGVTLRPGEEGQDLTDQALGVTVAYTPENATVQLTIPADRKPAQQLSQHGTPVSQVSPGIGGVLVNYNLATQIAGGQQATSLALDARTGGRWGVVSTTGQLNQSPNGFGMRRGMTVWQKDDLPRQRTWQAGDVYATPRIGPVALGGIRLAKDPAALDPLTPTWPVPTLGGIALDPGQVKVLSNQAEITRQDVKAGPFTVDGRNVAFGASQTAVVVRDAYGRETAVSTARLYVAPTLLRPGLSAWEIAAGQVREDENRYGTAGISGSWAKGVNDRWTIRAGGQVDEKGNGNLTLGSTWAPGTWGVLDGEVGRSSDGGTRWAAAYDYRGPTFGLRLEHEENDGFWRLQGETALPIASRTQASISYRPDRRFTVRGTYSAIDTGRSRLAFASLGVSANPHHLVARRRLAVPGTAHRHEGVPPVSCRKLLAGVEQHLHGGRVGCVAEHHGLACRRPLLFADLPWRCALGIHPVLAPDVGPTILLSFLNAVELLGLLIVAQVVDAVIHPPQLPRFGVPSKADGVPQAAGKDGPALAIRRGPQQRRMLGIGLVARVTGRAHADVEHPIGAKGQRAVGVLTAIGQVVDDPSLGTQRAVRVYGGAIHVVGRGDIQLPVGDGQPVRSWT
ncbi:fimbria/pilus outer membrane usher protein [Stenotrophomonas maltophilia]|nr:fimbria/pilus outer membrane usher protein [Stenotrophomonas maltophilia]MCU1187019.1 fimbria/pilus outer membrane usher protein [Stenotrophomonas maltophilia]